MEPKELENAWCDYEANVLPADAGEVQRRETRRAFYAGANALIGTLFRHLERTPSPDDVTEADLDLLSGMVCELRDFADDVAGGRA